MAKGKVNLKCFNNETPGYDKVEFDISSSGLLRITIDRPEGIREFHFCDKCTLKPDHIELEYVDWPEDLVAAGLTLKDGKPVAPKQKIETSFGYA